MNPMVSGMLVFSTHDGSSVIPAFGRRRRPAGGWSAVRPSWPRSRTSTASPAGLGTVKFANSCGAEVQPEFARGMALLHSFEFGPAIDAFQAVAAKDPSCADRLLGHGGGAVGQPVRRRHQAAGPLPAGPRFAGRAKAAGAKTARERDFTSPRPRALRPGSRPSISARGCWPTATRWPGSRPPIPTTPRRHVLRAVARVLRGPADKTYADQLKAGAILEKLWAAQPDHPGIAHYIIHSYDVPALAPRAVDAARRYAKIAPVGAARAAHAVAHVHAARLLAGLDRHQHPVGRRGAQGQRDRRRAARHRLPGLRVPADRPGRGRAPRGRFAGRDSGAPRSRSPRRPRRRPPAFSRPRRFRRATRSSAARGPTPRAWSRARRRFPTRTR